MLLSSTLVRAFAYCHNFRELLFQWRHILLILSVASGHKVSYSSQMYLSIGGSYWLKEKVPVVICFFPQFLISIQKKL